MADTFEDHPFWDYSYAVYGREGVSPALIAMQDRHGLDVNILLLCLWAGHSGHGVLSDDEFGHVLAVSSSWNFGIVCGLRQLRIRLRDDVPHVARELSDAIRKRLLSVEIDCEHVEQLAFAAGLAERADMARPAERRFEDCLANLSAYFDRCRCALTTADRDDLVTILVAAFPEVSTETVQSACDAQFVRADQK